MFLAYFARGVDHESVAFHRAVNDFQLDGLRSLTTLRRGRLSVAIAADRPLPASATEPHGRRFVVASGDAYDAEGGNAEGADLASTLLARFIAHGEGLTPPRNGTFAFLAHDSGRDEVVVGNDAFGFHPLFVLETAEFVAVSSEVEPLMLLAPDGAALDRDGAAEFFTFGSTLGGRTLIAGVRNLDPGTIETFTLSDARRRTHDDLAIEVDHGLGFDGHVDRVAAAIQRAVRARLERYPEATVTLTGGADTRLILSCMTPEQRQRARFATHYLVEGQAEDDRDVAIARMLAARAGLRHEAIHRVGARAHFSPTAFRRLRERPVQPGDIHGVWGGEFLGGAAVDVALFPVDRITRATVAERVQRLLTPQLQGAIGDPYDALRRERARCKAENGEFQFWIGMFARPFLTHLYFGSAGLSAGAWMWPWAQNLRLTSPFQDADFLRTLLAVPFELVSGYRLYNALYRRHFTEFNDIPTNSGLAVRSDSALTMLVNGTEPKRRHKDLSRESRRAGFAALDVDGEFWQRDVLARDAVRAQCLDEVADHPPTIAQRLKHTYTSSFLFRSRRHLPVHDLLMRWKSKHETAKAASLESVLVGAVVDFDCWLRYVGLETPQRAGR
ncbi:MAG: asparagine synthase-related protein [Planctomycetota bacterium]